MATTVDVTVNFKKDCKKLKDFIEKRRISTSNQNASFSLKQNCL